MPSVEKYHGIFIQYTLCGQQHGCYNMQLLQVLMINQISKCRCLITVESTCKSTRFVINLADFLFSLDPLFTALYWTFVWPYPILLPLKSTKSLFFWCAFEWVIQWDLSCNLSCYIFLPLFLTLFLLCKQVCTIMPYITILILKWTEQIQLFHHLLLA